MRLIKTAVIILAASSLLGACETAALKFGGITRDDAVALANKELARRHLTLPADYTVHVPRAITATFQFPNLRANWLRGVDGRLG